MGLFESQYRIQLHTNRIPRAKINTDIKWKWSQIVIIATKDPAHWIGIRFLSPSPNVLFAMGLYSRHFKNKRRNNNNFVLFFSFSLSFPIHRLYRVYEQRNNIIELLMNLSIFCLFYSHTHICIYFVLIVIMNINRHRRQFEIINSLYWWVGYYWMGCHRFIKKIKERSVGMEYFVTFVV